MSQSGPFGTVEVRVPIFQRGESVIDHYGGGAAGKSHFDDEMRKMEDEMGKLTGQINEGNKKIASRIVQTTKTTTTRSSSGSFGNANQYQQAIQHQPQQQQNFQSHNTSTQSFSNTGNNQFDQGFPGSQDIQNQGGVVETRRTVTTHKTVTHSSSGGNLLQNQPQAVQWSPAGSGSNTQESHSTHTQQFSSNQQNNQNQTQNNQIQWGSPAGSNVQEQRSFHSTTTHSTSGQQQQNQQQQQQQPGQIQWGSPAGSTGSSTHEQRSHHTTTTSHSTSGQQQQHHTSSNNNQQSQFDQQNNQELQQWLGNLQSPLISDHQEISGQDGKCLRLRFDVSQYRADEVSVKVVDGKLRIHAKHEEKTDNRSAYREFSKEFSLPIGTDPATIKSSLSKEGILTVEAPFPNQLTSQGYMPQLTY